MKKYAVGLKDHPTMTVEAKTPREAQAAYQNLRGIVASDNPFTIVEVDSVEPPVKTETTGDPAAGGTVPAAKGNETGTKTPPDEPDPPLTPPGGYDAANPPPKLSEVLGAIKPEFHPVAEAAWGEAIARGASNEQAGAAARQAAADAAKGNDAAQAGKRKR